MIGKSKDYTRAEELISWLRQDDSLRDIVFEEVFCVRDQCAKLPIRERSYDGCVAVGIDNPHNLWADNRNLQSGRLYATIMVNVLVSVTTTPPEPHKDFASYLSGLIGHCLGRLKTWSPYGPDSAHVPVIVDVVNLDLTDLSDMQDVIGKTIIMSLPVNF